MVETGSLSSLTEQRWQDDEEDEEEEEVRPHH